MRYGVMHRNTYINSPGLLDNCYRLRNEPRIRFAGQMTGVEGYIESAGSGFVAGLNAYLAAVGMPPYVFSRQTMLGSMAHYVSHGGIGAFTPMNANFGIIEPLEKRVKGGKVAKNQALADRSLALIDLITEELQIRRNTENHDQ